MRLASFVAVALLLMTGPARAVDYRAEPLSEPPPADALSPEIAEQLAPTGAKVVRGQSRTLVEIWPAKQWDVKADFTPSLAVLYPFKVGDLVAVARYKSKGEDFRGQEIPAGVYTVRYGLQPVDGNHIGTSDTRDFLVLIPAEEDKQPGPMDEQTMFMLSPKTTGGTHPAILSLLRVAEPPESLPAASHDEERELWSLLFSSKAKAGEKTSPLVVEAVVVGHGEE